MVRLLNSSSSLKFSLISRGMDLGWLEVVCGMQVNFIWEFEQATDVRAVVQIILKLPLDSNTNLIKQAMQKYSQSCKP